LCHMPSVDSCIFLPVTICQCVPLMAWVVRHHHLSTRLVIG